MMDIGAYRRVLEQYVREAIKNSDGTASGIAQYLDSIKSPGRFASHRLEKQTALREAIKAFGEHRHWPVNIIISHLGVEIDVTKDD
jgi:butyrate kinase